MNLPEIGVFTAAAAGVTKTVDMIRDFVKHHAHELSVHTPSYVWTAVAIIVGISSAVSTKMNLFVDVDFARRVSPRAGEVVTGFVLAGGADVAHKILNWMSGKAKIAQQAALEVEIKQKIIDDPDGGERIEDEQGEGA